MGRRIALLVITCGMLLPACKKESSGPDLSNPRAAAITFTRAVEAGDAETAQEACYAAGMEKDLVDAMALAIPALKRLQVAAEAKFGANYAPLMDDPNLVNGVASLQAAELSGDENRAKLSARDGKLLSVLKHVDGVWKVDVGASVAGRDLTDQVPQLQALGKCCDGVTRQIESGTIKTAAEAKRQLTIAVLRELKMLPTTSAIASPATAPVEELQ